MFKLMTLIALMGTQLVHAEVDSIIGTDTRTQVVSIQRDPIYRSIGFVLNSEKNTYCTGTLISPKHVLTNGHCVIPSQKFPSSLVSPKILSFNPGKIGMADGPLGAIKIVRIKTFSRWVQNGDPDYDVAILELEKPLALPVVRIASIPAAQLNRKKIFLTGYTTRDQYGTLWDAQGIIESIFNNEQSFVHSADTTPGASGSLVRIKMNNQWIGVGIHRGNYLGGSEEMNRGVLFNKAIYSSIQNWIK